MPSDEQKREARELASEVIDYAACSAYPALQDYPEVRREAMPKVLPVITALIEQRDEANAKVVEMRVCLYEATRYCMGTDATSEAVVASIRAMLMGDELSILATTRAALATATKLLGDYRHAIDEFTYRSLMCTGGSAVIHPDDFDELKAEAERLATLLDAFLSSHKESNDV